ncbi:MAG: PhzF family phenazine biosynthesis protein [Promethearchaeota archaeon]
MVVLPFIQTSVFVDSRYAFGGNQLATFWDAAANDSLDSEDMQGIALEMNFSETTFISPSELPGCTVKARIFTPARELPFAGHPTLGTAYVLRYKQLIESNKRRAALELGIGEISIEFLSGDVVRMLQPRPEFLQKIGDRKMVAELLGLSKSDITTDYPIQYVSTGSNKLIVPLVSLAAVQRAQPDSQGILQGLEGLPSRNILIFCTETVNEDSDVHARFFAPEVGVVEDPATGSAAGPLAAYLEQHQVLSRRERGKPIVIEQGYEIRRPSQLVSEVIGDNEIKGVLVSGKVKLTAEGRFYL